MKLTFEQAKGLIHRRLDGDTLRPEEAEALAERLQVCAQTRLLHEDLVALQQGLRGLRAPQMPEASLETVWAATTGAASSGGAAEAQDRLPLSLPAEMLPQSDPSRPSQAIRGGRWMPWAAAAAVLLAAVGSWFGQQRQHEAELAEAQRQLEVVFKLTSDAIDKSAERAVRGVVEEELRPALQQIPVVFRSPRDPRGET